MRASRFFFAIAFVLWAASCGAPEPDSAALDQNVSSQVVALSAPPITWFCSAGFAFFVTEFEIELIGYDHIEDTVRVVPATNSSFEFPAGGICNGNGGLMLNVTVGWVAPKVRVTTGIYEFRVTPKVATPADPVLIDLSEPSSTFCSVPGGQILLGYPGPLPQCGSSQAALAFVLTSVI